MNACDRARLSLDGLSVGDAFGECFFGDTNVAVARILRPPDEREKTTHNLPHKPLLQVSPKPGQHTEPVGAWAPHGPPSGMQHLP